MARERGRRAPVDAIGGKRNYSASSESILPFTSLYPRATAGNMAPANAITILQPSHCQEQVLEEFIDQLHNCGRLP